MQHDALADQLEADRPRLVAMAHRMLGSRPEAEDAVQDAWLRLAHTDAAAVDNLGGWLTTVVARICLDRLRSRRARPEQADASAGDGEAAAGSGADPAGQALLADSVGAALLVVLDSLPPAERVAFVLHDVFAVPFDEIAPIVERSSDATRQLASRARRRVQGATPAGRPDPRQHREVVAAFLRAAQGGDFDGLLRILDPSVELRPDAAAAAMGSLRGMRGADAVATALSGGARGARLAVVDGLAALVWAPQGDVRGVIRFTIDDGRVTAIDVTGDAGRIAALDIVLMA